jgi:hypothetical protein
MVADVIAAALAVAASLLAAEAPGRARALLAELEPTDSAGDHADAAVLHADAAARWKEFGNVPERAYARLGQGRCLAALRSPAAKRVLRDAQALFASIGYKPALTRAEAVLARRGATAAR